MHWAETVVALLAMALALISRGLLPWFVVARFSVVSEPGPP